MARIAGKTATYELADQFRQRCLRQGKSLVWPAEKSWIPSNLDALRILVSKDSDIGEARFFEKLRDELSNASDELHRIAADTLVFYYLFPSSTVGFAKKIEAIKTVLSWRLGTYPTDFSPVERAFREGGLGAVGTAYITKGPAQIQFIMKFAQTVQEKGIDPDDSKALGQVADTIAAEIPFAKTARHVVMHLLFPDLFERIASDRDKRQIVEQLSDRANHAVDLDDALMQIRQSFVAEGMNEFDFYRPEIRQLWMAEPGEQDEAATHDGSKCWIFQANPKYYDIQSAIKTLKEQTWLVRQSYKQIRAGDTAYIWQSGREAGIIAVGTVLTDPAQMESREEEKRFSLKPSMFEGLQTRVRLRVEKILNARITRETLKEHPILSSLGVLSFSNATNFPVRQSEADALRELLNNSKDSHRPRVWIEKTLVGNRPDRLAGDRALGRVLWSPQKGKRGADIYHWMRDIRPGDVVLHLTDNEAFTGISTVRSEYENADGVPGTDWAEGPCYLVRLRDFKKLDPELSRVDFFAEPYRERLLSLLESSNTNLFYNREFNLNQGAYLTPAPPELVIILNEAYATKTQQPLVIFDSYGVAVEKNHIQPQYSLSQFATDTGIAEVLLMVWLQALERKGQAIFYGPPGTGKTFVAERMARHLISGGNGFSEVVQFHPSYAYEDFIQGIRPKPATNGGLDYSTVPGRFLEFCDRAKRTQDLCVLIIDEINRAHLSRVFGELMYLLEYRDRQVPLSGGGCLRVPGNVRIIGTMNTADRSIALVDHALRRRFAFISLRPDYDILKKFHSVTGFDVEGLVSILKRLNAQINDPNYEIGITFFLRANLREEIPAIWTMEIEPYLEEYFFDQPDTVDGYRWARVCATIL